MNHIKLYEDYKDFVQQACGFRGSGTDHGKNYSACETDPGNPESDQGKQYSEDVRG